MAGTVQEIDAKTLAKWMQDDTVVLVDIREVNEWQAERIPGAVLKPMSSLDLAELVPPAGKKVVLQCRSGRRTMNVGMAMLSAGHKEAAHLTGGIIAWKEAGLPTQSG
jgi:rhodanese-related sulfurtransferase